MTNMHQGCDYYIEQNDMCLLFFQLGFFNISQYLIGKDKNNKTINLKFSNI